MMTRSDEEIKVAEQRMRQAYDALIAYVDRPKSQPTDIKLHRRLETKGRKLRRPITLLRDPFPRLSLRARLGPRRYSCTWSRNKPSLREREGWHSLRRALASIWR